MNCLPRSFKVASLALGKSCDYNQFGSFFSYVGHS